MKHIRLFEEFTKIGPASDSETNTDITVSVEGLKKTDLPYDKDSVKELNKALKRFKNKKHSLAWAVLVLMDMIGVDVNVEEIMDVFGVDKNTATDALWSARGDSF
jgi:hypothetical protein